MPNYKFYINIGGPMWPVEWKDLYFGEGDQNLFADGLWHQVYPGVGRDFSIEFDIWDHKYRPKLSGDLVFMNNQLQADYSELADIIYTGAEVNIRIERSCTDTTASDWFVGYFSIVDCKWDADRGLCTVNPTPNDKYRLPQELGDTNVNLHDYNPSVSVGLNYGEVDSGYPIYSDCTALSPSEWQAENDPPPGTTWNDYAYTSVSPCFGGLNIYEFIYQVDNIVDFGNGRGMLLRDAIQAIASTVYAGEYVSTFFENDEYPTGHPLTPIGSKNYVTNTDPNPLNGMVLIQKSNIRTTSDPATKWDMTFNQLMEMLKNTFNVDWFIDDDDKFRIEHVSYFDTTSGSDLDLTALDGGKWVNRMNKWEYDTNEMFSREHFKFNDSFYEDFIGKDIEYNRIATFCRYKDKVKNYEPGLSTDALNLYVKMESLENDGYALVTVGSDMVILNEVGTLSSDILPNAHLSWANLHNNYWRHDRILGTGIMNGQQTTFETYRRNIKQAAITYPECCGTFDPLTKKLTNLGEGEVGAAKYRMIDGMIETVFFYHNVMGRTLKIGIAEPETYHISINGWEDVLANDTDKLIHHG